MECKSRFSSRKRKGQSKSSAMTAFVVLISIGLVALIIAFSPLGTIITENVITPIVSCFGKNPEDRKIVSVLDSHDEHLPDSVSSAPTENPIEKGVFTIDATQFYILQMGVYTDSTEAKKHAEEIALIGAGGNIFQDGSVYRVFAAAYTDEDSVLKVQSQVRKDGFEATPYVTDKDGIKVTLEGNAEAIRMITEAVPLLSDVPELLSELTLKFDKEEFNDSEIIKRLNELQKKCEEQIKALESVPDQAVGPITDLLQKYKESISTFLREHDTINAGIRSCELKHLQLDSIIDYILFFDME